MLVVPIFKDVIETSDGNTYKVVEYTNYKEGGPAVYAKSPNKEIVLVYFFDIVSLNKTKVEYVKGSKVLHALGKIDREQQLPQPDDKVTVLSSKISDENDTKDIIDVDSLKLKSKSQGINRGMFIKSTDGDFYRLKQILDIDPALGNSVFDKNKFNSIYKDYMGV